MHVLYRFIFWSYEQLRRLWWRDDVENGSGAYLEAVIEKMTAKFIPPILLLKHLNAKLETLSAFVKFYSTDTN